MILEQIIAQKKKEVDQAQATVSQKELAARAPAYTGKIRDFIGAIAKPGRINLIAEIKKTSPSKGLLCKDFQPLEIARQYEQSGACAISVLTDQKFFQGDLAYLAAVKDTVKLPILRKDFIIDQYQIYESLCQGADSLLLIAQILTAKELKQFYSLCTELNLIPVCEVHNQADLDKVLACDCAIIGINNRNLATFEEDLRLSARLIKNIPQGKLVISESAIKTAQDLNYLRELGVNAVLIGEALMRSDNIADKIKELIGD